MIRFADDWEKVKSRYAHWWKGERCDRALIQVTAPRQGAGPALPWKGGAATAEEKWTDIEFAIWSTEQHVERTWYGGEAIPTLLSYQSPLGMSGGGALLLGCAPRYADDTVWVDPLEPAGRLPALRIDEGFHRRVRESMARAARESRGRWFMRESFANQAGDTLALARGTERLLVDIEENPRWVAAAVKRVSDLLLEVNADLWPLASPEVTGMEGYASSAGMWSPVVNACLDCDFSCMISPRHFEELFLPPLVETMRATALAMYHLDGTEAIRHLDALLPLPELHAIQWVPGAGREAVLQWVPLIRRIQSAGKAVQVLARPREVEPLLREVSARGLLITTDCASEEEGRELVRLVGRLSRQRLA